MSARDTIGITASTGALGHAVLQHLLKQHVGPVRLLARNPAKALEQARSLSETSILDAKACDYEQPDKCKSALEGVTTLLFISAHEDPKRVEIHRQFIDAADAAGVKHIVYTSFHGAAKDATFVHARDHFHTEEYIKSKSGLKYTFLRNSYYHDILPHFAINGVLRGPAGNGRFCPIARDDIAQVAAAVLWNPGAHEGRTYSLTGPQELTMSDIAAVLGEGTRFIDETMEEAQESRRGMAEQWLIDAWISTYTAIRDGEEAGLTKDVERVLGRPGISFQAWFTRYRGSIVQ